MPFDAPFACIVGAPRSGTSWLHAMLGAHPRICTVHELKLFDLFTVPWEQSWRRLIQVEKDEGAGRRGLRIVWSDEEFYDVLSQLTASVYDRVRATKPGATIVLDKSPGYSPHIAHICSLIPHARFIHVIRDGRDVAVSLRAASRDWARSWAPRSIDAAASLWKKMVISARVAEALGPERYIEVRYEELHSEGAFTLGRVLSFLGADAPPGEAQGILEHFSFDRMQSGSDPFDLPSAFFRSGVVGRWRTELSVRERYLIDYSAGDLLCSLGYARSDWWLEHRHQRWTVPLLAGTAMQKRIRALANRLSRGLNPFCL